VPTGPLHIVLVPGLLCSPRLYERVLPAIWAHGAVTIADTRRDDTVAGVAARLLATAPERFALAGLSMGGYISLEVMRQAPDRVRALALLSTSARPDTPEQSEARRAQTAMARDGRFDEVVENAFPVLVDAGARDDAELHAIHVAMARTVGPEVYCAQQSVCLGRPDSRPLLAAIDCPVAVVHGAGDQLINVEHGEELAAAIPGAQRTIVGGCGHMSALEQPATVARALDTWLTAARAPAA